MSAKKSFSGTPYARTPSTPRQQVVHQESAPGSILKTLFSPANWFGRKSSPRQAEEEDGSSESESSEEEEDEEGQIGLNQSKDQVQTANTPKMYPNLPQTPAVSQPGSQAGSPNAVLATFFSNKGDNPLTEVELEGVKALLARQGSSSPQTHSQANIPSYATPARRPYQPIFTPARMAVSSGSATDVKKVRRTGYTPSTSAVSPFKRSSMRTGFTQPKLPQSNQPSTPAKYELRTTIASSTTTYENGKRGLEEVAAPAAKRSRPDDSQDEKATKSPVSSTGNRTAASILEILDSDAPTTDSETTPKSPEQLKTMLNPYASSASPRKPVASPRRTPARKETRSAIEEIARNDAIEKKIPYQPKKSSGLANSFSAGDDDISLFSPKRRINPSSADIDADEHRQHGGFTFGGAKSQPAPVETPIKSGSALTSAFGSQSTNNDMFKSTPANSVHSTTPKFSFAASQMSNRSSVTQENGSLPIKENPAPAFTFGAERNNTSEHKSHGGFSFGLSPSDQIKPSQESEAVAPAASSSNTDLVNPDAASSTPATPNFSFGASTTDQNEHKAHGGFTVGESTRTNAFDLNVPDQSSQSNTAAPEDAEDQDLMVHQLHADSGDQDQLVHQLRDGTEYISPSKPHNRLQDSVSSKSPSSAPAGFVFQPSHTKSASSFSFNSYKESNVTPATTGGFSFDANKKVDIIGKTIGESTTKSASIPIESTISTSPRERVLALSKQELQTFDFTKAARVEAEGLKKEVLAAEIITIKFTTPQGQSQSAAVKTPAAGGFDWSAAGMKKPEVGWTCDVCMVSNGSSASQCVSCESDRPTSVVSGADTAATFQTSSTPITATNGGGFNWAAAGMKKPEEQWTCSVCMVSNPLDKNVCLSCETEK